MAQTMQDYIVGANVHTTSSRDERPSSYSPCKKKAEVILKFQAQTISLIWWCEAFVARAGVGVVLSAPPELADVSNSQVARNN